MALMKRPRGATKQKKRLGRGPGSGNGTTAGKGTKGQNARSGGGVRPGFEGGQMPLYRRIARRGFSNYPFKETYVVINLSSINKVYKSGEKVTLETLREKGLIRRNETLVKILGEGDIKKKITVIDVRVSASAFAKITAAGGTVEGVELAAVVEDASEPVVEEAAAEEHATEDTANPDAETAGDTSDDEVSE